VECGHSHRLQNGTLTQEVHFNLGGLLMKIRHASENPSVGGEGHLSSLLQGQWGSPPCEGQTLRVFAGIYIFVKGQMNSTNYDYPNLHAVGRFFSWG
jgi:hypothetical protein